MPPIDEKAAQPGVHYLDFLRLFVTHIKPASYIELGTATGGSLAQIPCDAVCVDPAFTIGRPVFLNRKRTFFFQMTSDDFFAENDLKTYFPAGVDVAFLDGLHLFEYLLRDFINVERFCNKRSIILLHDCLPGNVAMTSRRFRPGIDWTGDVWKILPIFRKYRPDMRVLLVDCPPTGLVACSNLDPESSVLWDFYHQIVDEFADECLDEAKLRTLSDQFPLIHSSTLLEHPENITLVFPASRRPLTR